MDSVSVTYDIIKNKACIVCGLSFSPPRAGKLYCSNKCKQFASYHKDEINNLKSTKLGINDSRISLHRKEFDDYTTIRKKLQDYVQLKRREQSNYLPFDEFHKSQLAKLEKILPGYLKKIEIPFLTIEEWSFFKVLYHKLKKEDFLKLLSSFNYKFYQSLTLIQDQKNGPKRKINPIQTLYYNHILKIVEGKILFI